MGLNHGGFDQTESGSPVEEINFAFLHEGLRTGLPMKMSSGYPRPPTPQSFPHLTTTPLDLRIGGCGSNAMTISSKYLADVALDALKVQDIFAKHYTAPERDRHYGFFLRCDRFEHDPPVLRNIKVGR